MKKNILFTILGFVIISILFGFFYFKNNQKKYNGETKEVTLKLKWKNQAQFAGNYVAAEKGFYDSQGLKVNIIPYDFKRQVIDSLVSGEADFAIAGADELLLAREKGIPVKAIAVIYKKNPVVAYSLKKNNIIKPQDLIGKTVGIQEGSNTEYLYRAMLKKLNINSSKIKEVKIGYDAKELLDGSVDVSTGYVTNEPNLVIEKGIDVNNILMADYGVNLYADVVVVKEDLIASDPGLVNRFLSATLEGWQYAIENEKEAVDITLKYATSSNVVHETNMLSESILLINDGKSPLGWMDLSQWEQALNILLDQKILSKDLVVKDSFDMQFLADFYLKKNI